MSASVGEGSGQDVDLNLAPIIDCFTVLITYLLVTASFLTLSSVDVSVSATGTGAPPQASTGPPPMSMSIELKAGSSLPLNHSTTSAGACATVLPAAGVAWSR